MPPRTDCSAAISCGGFRLASDPRVVSTGSRCAIDKAAVLHLCRAWRPGDPSCSRQPTTGSATRPGLPAGPDNQAPGSGRRAPAGVIPTVHSFSTETRRRRSVGVQTMAGTPFLGWGEQVPRYANRRGPSRKASSLHKLWITCAVRGIPCAQPVGNLVDIKLFSSDIQC